MTPPLGPPGCLAVDRVVIEGSSAPVGASVARMTDFRCRCCGVRLADPLTPLPDGDLLFVPGEEAVPSGCFARVRETWHLRDFVPPYDVSVANGDMPVLGVGDFLLNTSDVHCCQGSAAGGRRFGWRYGDVVDALCPLCGSPIGLLHSNDSPVAALFVLKAEAVTVVA